MASRVALCSLLALAFLLIASPRAESAVSCGTVASAISPCVNYLKGAAPLSAQCCSGVKSLNGAASTTPDRQAACACLKSLAGKVSGLKPALAQGLPGKCGANVPYPISTSVDCSKVK
ncbi:non-specific lipid-transfer protein 1-like [Iris pallida]|uniref:Non-specific lipid-transfer protein n=1 Tax=Iris pallida TaxID=29817 RepID=A0AAX6ER35_IRIPA|nr:non-specific lipid-transfer protein 1-like [Iris pallida]KAJ6797991.1 non-specific lipid-transfer protein 1-like [Iris pallida]KAJ6806531.1 non-specific lipid-transfer protein 1-like [Iris pallida]KAJ6806532.1 non-specific lipid-transfer protein 1-like [Iris pallida]KAJ6806533.1 non-specific lipid-transfer protein 1-like [Iris pallida]